MQGDNERGDLTVATSMEPEIDPIAQHKVLRLFHVHSSLFICLLSLLNIFARTTKSWHQYNKVR